jgi:hypothetical protein
MFPSLLLEFHQMALKYRYPLINMAYHYDIKAPKNLTTNLLAEAWTKHRELMEESGS